MTPDGSVIPSPALKASLERFFRERNRARAFDAAVPAAWQQEAQYRAHQEQADRRRGKPLAWRESDAGGFGVRESNDPSSGYQHGMWQGVRGTEASSLDLEEHAQQTREAGDRIVANRRLTAADVRETMAHFRARGLDRFHSQETLDTYALLQAHVEARRGRWMPRLEGR
jgi:hypothetical protein